MRDKLYLKIIIHFVIQCFSGPCDLMFESHEGSGLERF